MQVTTLRQRNQQLREEVHDKQALRRKLQEQLVEAQSEWSAAAADQEQLQAQVHSLRHSLEVGIFCFSNWAFLAVGTAWYVLIQHDEVSHEYGINSGGLYPPTSDSLQIGHTMCMGSHSHMTSCQ